MECIPRCAQTSRLMRATGTGRAHATQTARIHVRRKGSERSMAKGHRASLISRWLMYACVWVCAQFFEQTKHDCSRKQMGGKKVKKEGKTPSWSFPRARVQHWCTWWAVILFTFLSLFEIWLNWMCVRGSVYGAVHSQRERTRWNHSVSDRWREE